MSKFLFSVILPVYQVEEYLCQCLDSFVGQCGDDVQILLIDDGSKDGSLRILREYEQRNNNVTVLSQPNRGVSWARNAGVQNALGEYILWVDPDDWVMPGWLAAIRRRVEDAKPDMLFYDYLTFDHGRLGRHTYGGKPGTIPVSRVFYDLTEDMQLTSVLWNKVIRRELFHAHAFDPDLKCMEDADILCRMIPSMEKIEYLPEYLYVYRIRNEGLVLTPDLSVAYRCYQLALNRLAQAEKQGFDYSKTGVYLQAKGFLCKYYRNGSPKQFSTEADGIRSFLARSRKDIFSCKGLAIKDKLKYLFIGNPFVGMVYGFLKNRKQNGGVP